MTTLILGAGIAGLSTAYTLKQAGQAATLLEARDRIGGRVYTNRSFADIPVEFGAELIHGHKVSTWEWVNRLALETVHWNKRDDSMVRLEDGRWLTMAEARAASAEFDQTRSWKLPDIAASEGESLEDYLGRIGFTPEQMRYVRRSYANACGEDLRDLNARVILQQLRNAEAEVGSGDFRILDGYDHFYDALADGLDIRLTTVIREVEWGLDIRLTTIIREVEWGPDGVRVHAQSGESFEAERAVITLPLGVLQSGDITFTPALPAEKQAALAGLRMGPVMKMVYLFEAALLPHQIGAIYSRYNPPMWWSPSLGRAESTVVWTAFFSGDWAREMLELGEAGALQKGLESLRRELNQPDLNYLKAEMVNWPEDPFARGGYSVVLPGHDEARALLAKPTPPLFWAGEASAQNGQAATVHGAYATGRRAAQEILKELNHV